MSARSDFSPAVFDFAANVARLQRDVILSHTPTRILDPVDPTEHAMHTVYDAVRDFEAAIDSGGSGRCKQLEERAETMAALWQSVFEQARDKGIALKGETS